MKLYNPESRYEDPKTILQPGALPKGARIQWPDGETATIIQSFLGTRHLVRRSAVGGGEQEDTFDLSKFDGLLTNAEPARGPGRPTFGDEAMNQRNIRIHDSLWEKAGRIGNGNGSNGIRKALEAWSE